MPRKLRFIIPGGPVHIVQRGRSREPEFYDEADYRVYLSRLKEVAEKYQCQIHAYVLMTNHIHLLATPSDIQGITRMMQYIGRHQAPYINHTYGGSGSIWEGRYKANLVQDDRYLLTCMRYLELNPICADMVTSPEQYQWSSFHRNGRGEKRRCCDVPQLVSQVKSNKKFKAVELFKAHVDDIGLSEIRNAWKIGTPLGNDYFHQKVESKLGCKVGQSRRGRPKLKLN